MKKLLAVLLTVCLLSTLWVAFAAADEKPTGFPVTSTGPSWKRP